MINEELSLDERILKEGEMIPKELMADFYKIHRSLGNFKDEEFSKIIYELNDFSEHKRNLSKKTNNFVRSAELLIGKYEEQDIDMLTAPKKLKNIQASINNYFLKLPDLVLKSYDLFSKSIDDEIKFEYANDFVNYLSFAREKDIDVKIKKKFGIFGDDIKDYEKEVYYFRDEYFVKKDKQDKENRLIEERRKKEKLIEKERKEKQDSELRIKDFEFKKELSIKKYQLELRKQEFEENIFYSNNITQEDKSIKSMNNFLKDKKPNTLEYFNLGNLIMGNFSKDWNKIIERINEEVETYSKYNMIPKSNEDVEYILGIKDTISNSFDYGLLKNICKNNPPLRNKVYSTLNNLNNFVNYSQEAV